MKIAKNSVVEFHYRLNDEADSTEIETSRGHNPALYLHGTDGIIPGLEAAMTGHEAGDVFTVSLAPEDAYGVRHANAIQRVPMKHLHVPKNAVLQEGHVVQVQTEGGLRPATVVKAGKFNVDVDLNHPLAGVALSFDIEVVSVRDATEEEVAHGHAHGVGGHHH